MSILAAPPLVTAEDLDKLPENGLSYEIVDGVLVEVPPAGAFESELELEVAYRIKTYVASGKASGRVLPATARFRLHRDPDLVRGPDVSFIRGNRLPPGPLPKGHLDLAPDLAVEIVSGSNPSSEVESMISEYLEAGVKMVWVIYPNTRTAYLYKSRGKVEWLDESGELDGGEALPGFRLRLAELFEAVGIRGNA